MTGKNSNSDVDVKSSSPFPPAPVEANTAADTKPFALKRTLSMADMGNGEFVRVEDPNCSWSPTEENNLLPVQKRQRLDTTMITTEQAVPSQNLTIPSWLKKLLSHNKNTYNSCIALHAKKFTIEQIERMIQHSPEILPKIQLATQHTQPLSFHRIPDLLREELVEAICKTNTPQEIDSTIEQFSNLARIYRFWFDKGFSNEVMAHIIDIKDKTLRNTILEKVYNAFQSHVRFKNTTINKQIRDKLDNAICSNQDVLKKMDAIISQYFQTLATKSSPQQALRPAKWPPANTPG